MFPSGALKLVSSRRRRTLRALAVVLLCLTAAASSLALAQAAFQQAPPAAAAAPPAIAVDSFRYRVGDTLHLSGQNLEPNATYSVTLTPPAEAEEEPRALEVTTDAAGGLRVDAQLRNAGSYIVGLAGPGIDARLTVQVEGPAGQAAPGAAQPGAAGQEAETPPASDEPDQAEEPRSEPSEQAAPGDEPGEEPEGQPEDEPGGQPEDELGGRPEDEPGDQLGGEPSEQPADRTSEEPDDATGPAGEQEAERPASLATRPDVELGDEGLVATIDGDEVWSLRFGPDSGESAGLLEQDDVILVGHGNHLLEVDAADGTVMRRDRLPAQIEDITRAAGRVVVAVRYASGETEELPWPLANDAARAFDPDPELYDWLENEADVADPAAQLERDPTNPWLYLAVAEDQPARRATLRRAALARAATFYEYGRLANDFMQQPDRDLDLAAQAMNLALQDFVDRGYRAELLFDESAAEAYGFPAPSLRAALDRDDAEAADFWAPYALRLSSGDAATSALLADYAGDLRSRGRAEEASRWQELAASTRRFEVRSTLERAARSLGSTGWYGVIALLVAILALHITLAAKYWRAQTENLALRAEAGRGGGRAARMFTLRYAAFTEKIVLLLLFAAVIALAALTGWVEHSGELPAGLGSGSLANPTSRALLVENLPEGAERAFVLGYAAQTAGDEERAVELYRDLSDDADAMNNLGVIRNDDELFRLALELRPEHPEAAYNLGLEENPSPLMAAYAADAPLLAAPDRSALASAAGGDYLAALGAAFTNPWSALTELRALEPHWLWVAIVVLFLLWVAWTILTLLIPRPATARTAPRTFLYHLLALLLPGSGLADELWGVVLLVPWAIFGIDTLLHFFAFQAQPTFPLMTDLVVLGVIYLINTVAFIVEYGSYRRRMRDLRAERAAPEYGLSDRDI